MPFWKISYLYQDSEHNPSDRITIMILNKIMRNYHTHVDSTLRILPLLVSMLIYNIETFRII